jgi:hypothetical protein
MDQDELSKDDLIGGTLVNLYEILNVSTNEICVKRLLDDRSVRMNDGQGECCVQNVPFVLRSHTACSPN